MVSSTSVLSSPGPSALNPLHFPHLELRDDLIGVHAKLNHIRPVFYSNLEYRPGSSLPELPPVCQNCKIRASSSIGRPFVTMPASIRDSITSDMSSFRKPGVRCVAGHTTASIRKIETLNIRWLSIIPT